jgi:hypothetical protein
MIMNTGNPRKVKEAKTVLNDTSHLLILILDFNRKYAISTAYTKNFFH